MGRPREGVVIELGYGDELQIEALARSVDSEKICITLESKSGQKARLRIKAEESVVIGRKLGVRRPVPA